MVMGAMVAVLVVEVLEVVEVLTMEWDHSIIMDMAVLVTLIGTEELTNLDKHGIMEDKDGIHAMDQEDQEDLLDLVDLVGLVDLVDLVELEDT